MDSPSAVRAGATAGPVSRGGARTSTALPWTPPSPHRTCASSTTLTPASASTRSTTHVHRCDAPLAQSAWRLAGDVLQQHDRHQYQREHNQHDERRWWHTTAVVNRAAEAAGVLPPHQRALLVAAAWVHDIGTTATVQQTLRGTRLDATGFGPLDGARYLTIHGWPASVAALVARHAGAEHLAAVFGLQDQVLAYSTTLDLGPVADALTWASVTARAPGPTRPGTTLLTGTAPRAAPDAARTTGSGLEETVAAAVDRTERRRASTPST